MARCWPCSSNSSSCMLSTWGSALTPLVTRRWGALHALRNGRTCRSGSAWHTLRKATPIHTAAPGLPAQAGPSERLPSMVIACCPAFAPRLTPSRAASPLQRARLPRPARAFMHRAWVQSHPLAAPSSACT